MDAESRRSGESDSNRAVKPDKETSVQRSGVPADASRGATADEHKDEPEPAKGRRSFRGWLTLIVPVVSCLALVLSSWEFIRESTNSASARRSERMRGIQGSMMTLLELETEYRRALESSSQTMLPYGLNSAMQILLEATAEDVDALLEYLNPSVLISFAYYNGYAGNYVAAERYYSQVLQRLEDQPRESNRAARHATYVGLGNVYLADSPVADKLRGRELLEGLAAEYEREPDLTNRGYLVELLGGWAFTEQSLGNPTAARELRRRAREALAYLAPDDPRRAAYGEYLSGGGIYSPGYFLRMDGEWNVEFPDDATRRGAATIRRQATPQGPGWYIHAEVFRNSRMLEQWGGNGFVSESEAVVFPLQGYRRENTFAPPNPVFGTVQLQPSTGDEHMLEGTYNPLGAGGTRIRLRRQN